MDYNRFMGPCALHARIRCFWNRNWTHGKVLYRILHRDNGIPCGTCTKISWSNSTPLVDEMQTGEVCCRGTQNRALRATQHQVQVLYVTLKIYWNILESD